MGTIIAVYHHYSSYFTNYYVNYMGTHVGTKIPVTNGVSMDYAGKPMKTREELRPKARKKLGKLWREADVK